MEVGHREKERKKTRNKIKCRVRRLSNDLFRTFDVVLASTRLDIYSN